MYSDHNNELSAKEPLIPANQSLPEITLKALFLSFFLVILLVSANAYLGLKVGTTVSASIPAAIISMGVLRLFKKSNVLENNIVQTAASAGEALVSGIAFVLPALILIKFWTGFNYWETVLIGISGGILGVVFSVPIRKVLLEQKILKFPEGTAIGQVLKVSADRKSGGLDCLIKGGLVGSLISLCQTGFQVISDDIEWWFRSSSNLIYGGGIACDPALIAAGYIVGPRIGLSIFLGVVLGWFIGVPVLTSLYGAAAGNPADAAMAIWHSHIRYIGVGAMLVGGFWTLIALAKPIVSGLHSSIRSVKMIRLSGSQGVIRTERDLPIHYIGLVLLLMLAPLGFLLDHFASSSVLQLSSPLYITTIASIVLFIIIAGFIFSAIAGYFAGLVGSTNSPGSALSLSALMLICLMMLALFSVHHGLTSEQKLAATALAVVATTFICAANAITNETIQDLKAGQMVGATPWKQQTMMVLGASLAAFVIPLVLQLLFQAYGIGGVFPRPHMDPSQMLSAPQAGLMAALSQGVFDHNLPWSMILIGASIAIICILTDQILRKKGKGGLPVLAVGMGIYLPLNASVPFVIGGLAYHFINKGLGKRFPSQEIRRAYQERGLILACGMVAGSALMGVILAIPFALMQSSDALKLVPDNFSIIADILALIVIVLLLKWMYRVICRKRDA